jgi:hypothetical protein
MKKASLTQRIKAALRTRQAFADKAAEVANQIPGALVIIADPKTDVIYASYDGLEVADQIRLENGAAMNLVKKILNYDAWRMRGMTPDVKGTLDKHIDQFLIHIGDVLCSLAEAHYNESKGSNQPQPPTPNNAKE